MKKIVISLFTVLALLFTASPVMAAQTTITFEGETNSFNVPKESQDFENMYPGETRNAIVILKNDKDEKLDFYLSVEIPENVAAKGDQNAVYDFNVSKNDEEPFFRTVIGGKDDNTVGKEYLTDDNRIKLATLSKGEETKITVSLHLDGDSANNDYQAQSGSIKLKFYAGTATNETPGNVIQTTYTTTKKYVNQYYNAVKTGDPTALSSFVILGAGAVLGVIFLIVTRRKKEEK